MESRGNWEEAGKRDQVRTQNSRGRAGKNKHLRQESEGMCQTGRVPQVEIAGLRATGLKGMSRKTECK